MRVSGTINKAFAPHCRLRIHSVGNRSVQVNLVILLLWLVAACLASHSQPVDAQGSDQDDAPQKAIPVNGDPSADQSTRINLPFKTYGGTQFWTDHCHKQGYRIQSNWATNHWRLLDASDIRRAWGTREQCETVLNRLLVDASPEPESKEYVILLHGLMRTHQSMRSMQRALQQADCGKVICFSYASTRRTVGDHAEALQEVLTGLPDDVQISFVAHSMGNIVVRHLLADLEQNGDPAGLLERCRCMVMLGPPNQGAAIARRLSYIGLFGAVAGKGALELGPNWSDLVGKLAVPSFPFALIAGDLSAQNMRNPILDGASDFVVQVEETHLEGRESFATVPVLHSTLMKDETAQRLVIEFLQSH